MIYIKCRKIIYNLFFFYTPGYTEIHICIDKKKKNNIRHDDLNFSNLVN